MPAAGHEPLLLELAAVALACAEAAGGVLRPGPRRGRRPPSTPSRRRRTWSRTWTGPPRPPWPGSWPNGAPTTPCSARKAHPGRGPRASDGSWTRSTARPTSCSASPSSRCRWRRRWAGTTRVGIVVDPIRHETWAAVEGWGARRNGRPCRVASGRSSLSTALIATGFGYQSARREWQGEVAAHLLPRVRDIRRFGAAVAGPVLDGRWPLRRLLRVGPQPVGPGRRRPDLPGGRRPGGGVPGSAHRGVHAGVVRSVVRTADRGGGDGRARRVRSRGFW